MTKKPKIQDTIREIEDLMLQIDAWRNAVSLIKEKGDFQFDHLLTAAYFTLKNYLNLIEDLK